MKTKLFLIVAAVMLLAFTFKATSRKQEPKPAATEQSASESKGLAMEDRDQWK